MKDNNYNFAVYVITCLPNGKRYVGGDSRFPARKGQHWTVLRHNKHHNKHLQRAWNKYGENQFTFELVESCNSLNEMNQKEIEYIRLFDTFNKNHGFNLTLGGEGTLGRVYSAETRLKMSNSLTGLPRSAHKEDALTRKPKSDEIKRKIYNSNPNKKKLIQTDLDDNFIKEWNGVWATSRKLNVRRSTIQRALKIKNNFKRQNTLQKLGFKLYYKEDYLKHIRSRNHE